MICIKAPENEHQARAIADSLRDILSVRMKKFPNLVEIKIEVPFHQDDTKYDLEALEADASSVNVLLRKLDTIDDQPQSTWHFEDWVSRML